MLSHFTPWPTECKYLPQGHQTSSSSRYDQPYADLVIKPPHKSQLGQWHGYITIGLAFYSQLLHCVMLWSASDFPTMILCLYYSRPPKAADMRKLRLKEGKQGTQKHTSTPAGLGSSPALIPDHVLYAMSLQSSSHFQGQSTVLSQPQGLSLSLAMPLHTMKPD